MKTFSFIINKLGIIVSSVKIDSMCRGEKTSIKSYSDADTNSMRTQDGAKKCPCCVVEIVSALLRIIFIIILCLKTLRAFEYSLFITLSSIET